MVRVGLRTVTLTIPPQEVITRDNVPARVNAVAYFQVIDAVRAVIEVEELHRHLADRPDHASLGARPRDLDALLAERDKLNESLQPIIDEQTEPWGVKVDDSGDQGRRDPRRNMQRAMAREAEAERERRAKIINAEGEFQAAEKLLDAAEILSRNPAAIQLRYHRPARAGRRTELDDCLPTAD